MRSYDCPCDIDGICPYDAQYSGDCEYWCPEDREPDYVPEEDDQSMIDELVFEVSDDQLEMGFDPYEGGYTYDC